MVSFCVYHVLLYSRKLNVVPWLLIWYNIFIPFIPSTSKYIVFIWFVNDKASSFITHNCLIFFVLITRIVIQRFISCYDTSNFYKSQWHNQLNWRRFLGRVHTKQRCHCSMWNRGHWNCFYCLDPSCNVYENTRVINLDLVHPRRVHYYRFKSEIATLEQKSICIGYT